MPYSYWLYFTARMALDVNGVRFLLLAEKLGVSFGRTAMIGRQELSVDAGGLASELRRFGRVDADPEAIIETGGGYAESFLELLGAQSSVSFDASDYEGASHVHDMNTVIGEEHRRRYSAVIDGGTLEHVFDFPTAIKNCMSMVEVGGHYLAITPTNNYSGHGFYQFSPELYFRVFSPANGFEVVRMMAFEETSDPKWYDVADPDAVRSRVTIINSVPTLLLLIAKKTSEADVFRTPQQSDYLAAWNSEEKRAAVGVRRLPNMPLRKSAASLAASLRKLRRKMLENSAISKNTEHFTESRIDD
ncbi:MAG: hypothetical protein KF881_00610 [Acidobacteria bacterium]|nr:hypothetical protein [Acidobacteriota bacterium]